MIKGDNIILREMKLSDWDKTIKWRNDSEIKSLAMMHPFPVTEFIEKAWFKDLLKNKTNKAVYFTITGCDDSPLGYIFLDNVSQLHKTCYLGIVIGDSEVRGKGYGSEAITLISGYAFNTLNLNKISVEVIDLNRYAIHLYEKLGFVHEGRLKKQFFSDGYFHDVIIMSLFNNKII